MAARIDRVPEAPFARVRLRRRQQSSITALTRNAASAIAGSFRSSPWPGVQVAPFGGCLILVSPRGVGKPAGSHPLEAAGDGVVRLEQTASSRRIP
jgi:hypothetical protein